MADGLWSNPRLLGTPNKFANKNLGQSAPSIRKGCYREWEKMKNNGENSGPLTWLPLNHLNGGTCNADAYANLIFLLHKIINKNCWNQIFNLSVFGRKKFTNNV